MKDIFINKSIWNNFTDLEMENYVTNVFNYYREHGFPYFPTDNISRDNDLGKLVNYISKNDVFDDETNSFTQTMHGLALCWSFFPHSFGVRCNNKLSPIEVFNDDEMLLKVIKKRIRMGDNMSDSGLRKMLKIFSTSQSVSNFRPTAAASIYRYASRLLNNDKLRVWDMSSGYGGRLVGAHVSNVVETYIGTDPCENTHNGLLELCDYIHPSWVDNINMLGSEDFVLDNRVDLCFTSPPYFNTEKYSDEVTQSYIKFDTKDNWLNGFLGKTIDNCYDSLKDDGLLIINLANVPAYKTIEEDFLSIMSRNADKWERLDDLYLALSSLNKKNKFKYEPIFVFKKKI